MKIKAFQGLRPNPEIVDKLASLPYDVVNTAEARELAKDNPVSFLHVVRAEIDMPEGADMYAEETYQKAKENFQKLQDDGHLIRETQPVLFLYQQNMDGHVQKGIVATCATQDYGDNIIRKHEKTRPQKENDRLKLNLTIDAHPGPVFLTYRDDTAIDAMVAEIEKTEPLYDFTAPDGVIHTMWRISDVIPFEDAFAKVPLSYVADGHHRSASAYRLGKQRAEENPNHTGEEPYNYFPAVLFPASQLKILAYNRVVKDLNGFSVEDFLIKLKEIAEVTEDVNPTPDVAGKVSCYVDGKWYGLTFPARPDANPIEKLDVSYLQDKILQPMLGIDDPRTSDRVDFVGGIRGTKELEKRVAEGWTVAFSMYPTSVEELMDIADADAIMPPKSTWFEPKLRSGLFIHTV